MKVIIASEQIFNHHGDLIRIKYHYEDGSTSDRSIFITSENLTPSGVQIGFKKPFKVEGNKE
jgi:hypothetical protein